MAQPEYGAKYCSGAASEAVADTMMLRSGKKIIIIFVRNQHATVYKKTGATTASLMTTL